MPGRFIDLASGGERYSPQGLKRDIEAEIAKQALAGNITTQAPILPPKSPDLITLKILLDTFMDGTMPTTKNQEIADKARHALMDDYLSTDNPNSGNLSVFGTDEEAVSYIYYRILERDDIDFGTLD